MTISRLRIALVVHDYHRYGGHSRYVAELATRFRHDHDVHVFAQRVDDADRAGITFHHVPALRWSALTSILSFVLPATLAVRGFDIIHTQGLCSLRQHVVTAHICQAAWYNALQLQQGRLHVRQRVFRALVESGERRLYRTAPQVIAVSQRVADDLRHCYGRSDRVSVIHHGIDAATFSPEQRGAWRRQVRQEIGLSDNDCVALYVGDAQKALPAALPALAQVPGVHLAIVTRSDPGLYRSQLTGDLGARVYFVPPTPHIARIYAAADFFLFPTCYDAFGMVISEAMASGLPVITSRAAGAAEWIEHGVNGLLTEQPWDVAALARCVAQLAGDPALRERLGAAARATAERHTWDAVAARTLQVYQAALAPRA